MNRSSDREQIFDGFSASFCRTNWAVGGEILNGEVTMPFSLPKTKAWLEKINDFSNSGRAFWALHLL